MVCLKNTRTKFEACSYNSFQDMRDLSQNFRFSAKWSLFSDPVLILIMRLFVNLKINVLSVTHVDPLMA